MKGTKLLGVVLVIAGLLALAYGGFNYTRRNEKARLGPFSIEVQEKERVTVPLWAGVGVAFVGGLLLAHKR